MPSISEKKKSFEEEIQEEVRVEHHWEIEVNPKQDKLQSYEIKSIDRSTFSPSTNTQHATRNHIDFQESSGEGGFNAEDYLKSGIYGGLDGLINTLSLILGGVGAAAASDHILLICLAGLIGDGISMGLGDYLSSKSQLQFMKSEKKEKQLVVKNNPQSSALQMQKLYLSKGYNQYQSKTLTDCLATNPNAFMRVLIIQEMGLGSIEGSPAINGVVNFMCFTVFGFLPIFPYILNKVVPVSETNILMTSLATGGFLLIALGIIKAWLTGAGMMKSGIVTLTLGSFAVAIGYVIGVVIDS